MTGAGSPRVLLDVVGLVGDHQPDAAWLSNFSPDPVRLDVGRGERSYPTLEHAYQAAKARTAEDHDRVAAAPDPEQAKRAGRALERREDWREVRTGVMRAALAAKFAPGSVAARRLLATGDAVLVELAPHGDELNGLSPQPDGTWRGRNLVGVLLTERRGQLRLLPTPSPPR